MLAEIKPARLITHRFPLARADEAYDQLDRRPQEAVQVMLTQLSMMRVGLVIQDSIETLTGGCLYDRRLLDHLASQGDRAEVISLPGRNHYPAPSAIVMVERSRPHALCWSFEPHSRLTSVM